MSEETNIVERLIEMYESANKTSQHLSRVLNQDVSRQVVDRWRHQKYIPYKWGKDIERATEGRIKALEVWEAAAKHRHH